MLKSFVLVASCKQLTGAELRHLGAVLVASAPMLSGCALSFIHDARDSAPSDGSEVVIEGRINYEIDGQSKAPYGAFKPKWPAPFFSAVRLESGSMFASPAVNNSDGAFKWSLPPGSYLLTRIGFGNIFDDTYIAWPSVILCVPSQPGVLYAGHLRLIGQTKAEQYTTSTGKRREYKRVSYDLAVADERASSTAPGKPPPLMHVDEKFPAGDWLVEDLAKRRDALIARACPASQPG